MSPATRLLAGGFITLAIAMGVGRFYYTPLLPLMQTELGYGADVMGTIAAANFAGYLVGSVLMSLVPRGPARVWAFRLGILLSVSTTIGMGLTADLTLWLVLRFLSGFASAASLILGAGMVVEALAGAGEEGRVASMFCGLGFGIAASGTLVQATSRTLSASALWITAGVACAVLMLPVLAIMRERVLPPRARPAGRAGRQPERVPFWPLFINYSCEGLGYSVYATFIVAVVKSRPGLEAAGDWVWVIVGLSAMAGPLFWSWAAARIGFLNAMIGAFLSQIVAVLLPALSEAPAAALASAALFGAALMGITMLILPLGRHSAGGRGFGLVTAGFSAGQMVGPLAGGFLLAAGASHRLVLGASAAVLVVGTLALVLAAMRLRAP